MARGWAGLEAGALGGATVPPEVVEIAVRIPDIRTLGIRARYSTHHLGIPLIALGAVTGFASRSPRSPALILKLDLYVYCVARQKVVPITRDVRQTRFVQEVQELIIRKLEKIQGRKVYWRYRKRKVK